MNLDGKMSFLEIPPFIYESRNSPFFYFLGKLKPGVSGRWPSSRTPSGRRISYTEEQQIQFKNLREEKKRKQRKIFYLAPSGRLKIDRNIYDAIEKEYEEKMKAVLTSEQKKKMAEGEAARPMSKEELRRRGLFGQ